jgi:hypothetical protein
MVDKGDYYECPNDGCKGIRDIDGWQIKMANAGYFNDHSFRYAWEEFCCNFSCTCQGQDRIQCDAYKGEAGFGFSYP